jgi:succinate dehydrogenase/fumarate reductase cytochrome b subunit
MTKSKGYRILGWFFVVIGIAGGLGEYIPKAGQSYEFQQFIANLSTELIPAVFMLLVSFALNYVLWIGLLILWRADKIENPQKKSKWLKIIKPYAIFTVVTTVILLIAILLPAIIKRGMK